MPPCVLECARVFSAPLSGRGRPICLPRPVMLAQGGSPAPPSPTPIRPHLLGVFFFFSYGSDAPSFPPTRLETQTAPPPSHTLTHFPPLAFPLSSPAPV